VNEDNIDQVYLQTLVYIKGEDEGEDSCYRLTIKVPVVSFRTQDGVPNPTAYTTGLLRHFRRCVLYTTHKRNVELTLIFQSL
jgi:hypothetical protein